MVVLRCADRQGWNGRETTLRAEGTGSRGAPRRRVAWPLIGALPLVCALSALGGCSSRPDAPRRVLIVSIDTCRVDHMSVYGYRRATTPFLQELAGRGVLFTQAFTQVPDTTPAHASLFTSRYPFEHGAANGVPLRDEFTTLAEILGGEGFRTAAFVSGWTMGIAASGLAQGFDTYDDEMTHAGSQIAGRPNERLAAETTDRALEWLKANAAGDVPFFMFVHYFDPHGRYLPPAPYDSLFPPEDPGLRLLHRRQIPDYARIGDETDVAVYEAMYDGEIRYVDDQIRRLLGALEARGLSEDTLVVVVGDHGESLTEHGVYFSHGWRLHDPATRIPLIMSYPGRLPAGKQVGDLAQLVDVMPTILDLLRIEPPGEAAGQSLLPPIQGREWPGNPWVLSRTTKSLTYLYLKEQRDDVFDHYAIRTTEWKYLHSEDGKAHQLFNVQKDPQELNDLSRTHPDRVEELRDLLSLALSDRELDVTGFLDSPDDAQRKEIEDRLRSLGYIN